jgi:hypothetical protein
MAPAPPSSGPISIPYPLQSDLLKAGVSSSGAFQLIHGLPVSSQRDRDTLRGVFRGQTNPQSALLEGRLHVGRGLPVPARAADRQPGGSQRIAGDPPRADEKHANPKRSGLIHTGL